MKKFDKVKITAVWCRTTGKIPKYQQVLTMTLYLQNLKSRENLISNVSIATSVAVILCKGAFDLESSRFCQSELIRFSWAAPVACYSKEIYERKMHFPNRINGEEKQYIASLTTIKISLM